ncbi:MAG: ATP synthase F0 subunit C [Pseudobdellovibrionaceae bacterium]|nr:ATP synthase F0 subunit C [Bdellovibrionales bacterium]USN46840.1 MAG: ATP synthase F0 subunit C [Pseudobdellovibrionaceae bacterium]
MKKAKLLSLLTLLASVPAFAAEGELSQSAQLLAETMGNSALFAIAAGIGLGMAAIGGALGQGKIGAAAMDGIARNPQAQKSMFVPMIVGLALIESLVIYVLVIAFMIVGKI